MQPVRCPHCSDNFDFDPSQIWDSPGQVTKARKTTAPRVVIQCPKCRHWITVELPNGSSKKAAPT
ncbi:MAG TPA: hypothetical protein VKS79_03410 [Gemmataceae bacterium]|nr:hypothetical protein [Gemmataceae bacterium]